jgi:hypothetical protein
MAFTMTSLNKSKLGAYTARKAIPKDVREAYQRLLRSRHMPRLIATLPCIVSYP